MTLLKNDDQLQQRKNKVIAEIDALGLEIDQLDLADRKKAYRERDDKKIEFINEALKVLRADREQKNSEVSKIDAEIRDAGAAQELARRTAAQRELGRFIEGEFDSWLESTEKMLGRFNQLEKNVGPVDPRTSVSGLWRISPAGMGHAACHELTDLAIFVSNLREAGYKVHKYDGDFHIPNPRPWEGR